tara:strand:- start:380 stop:616 length:237 start_codon:yes stop_codon:yes gene_type:complete
LGLSTPLPHRSRLPAEAVEIGGSAHLSHGKPAPFSGERQDRRSLSQRKNIARKRFSFRVSLYIRFDRHNFRASEIDGD